MLLLQHDSFGGCCMLRKGEKRIMRISYSTLLLSLLASWRIWHAHETSSILNFIIFLTFERSEDCCFTCFYSLYIVGL